MEAIIRRSSKSKSAISEIIRSEDDELIQATYRLFLYYDCPLELFLKLGLEYELEIQGESIFREARAFNRILTELFSREPTVDLLLKKARRLIQATRFNVRSAAFQIVTFLDDVMIPLLSDRLVYFLVEICRQVNGMNIENFTAERIVTSFLIFRVISPRLINGVDPGRHPEAERTMELVRMLNKIATGDIFDTGTEQTFLSRIVGHISMRDFILREHERLVNLLGRALLRQKR